MPYPPDLGLGYIKAALMARGHDTRVLDFNWMLYTEGDEALRGQWLWKGDSQKVNDDFGGVVLRRFLGRILDAVEEAMSSGFNVFGFSVWESNKTASLMLAALLKERNPAVKIIFGGPECMPLCSGPEFAKNENVDAVIYGEGDETFLDLLNASCDGQMVPCRGTLVRLGGAVVDLGERNPVDPSRLPFPNYADYFNSQRVDNRLAIAFNRGCVRRCNFCSVPGYIPKFRWRPAENILAEIKNQIALYGARRFYEVSPTATSNVRELSRLCDLLISGRLNISWEGFSIFSGALTFEVLKKMRDSGCFTLAFGLESGSQRIVDAMQKGFRIPDAERILKDCKTLGIWAAIGTMVGYPGETDEDFEQTMDFVRRNVENIRCVGSVSVMGIHVYSPLYFQGNVQVLPENVKEERKRRLIDLAASLGLYNAQHYPINVVD